MTADTHGTSTGTANGTGSAHGTGMTHGTGSPNGTGNTPGALSSWRLLLAFREEQRDPDRFYRMLAADTAALVDAEVARHGDRPSIDGAVVVDVGSGPGDLAEAFRDRGARAVAVDVDWDEMHVRPRALEQAVVGDGRRLPFGDGVVDVACASNVLEHVPDPLGVVADMARVTRPGGVVFVNYTLWLSPWGGHETSPWHYLGGARAVRRYEQRLGRSPKNRFGSTLFPMAGRRFLDGLRHLEGVVVVDSYPRYFPRWTRGLPEVPVIGDLLTWNLAVVMVRQGTAPVGVGDGDEVRSPHRSSRGHRWGVARVVPGR